MRQIVFLILNGAQLLDFAGPHDVFSAANQAIKILKVGHETYKIRTVSEVDTVRISDDQSLLLSTTPLSFLRGPIDTIVIVGGQNMVATFSPTVVSWLKRASAKARRTVSVCTGAFLLAAAGLLDGRRAATHWFYCGMLARRYPKISVDNRSIYVQDGNIYSSAGVSAGIDLALHLVEQDHGSKVALAVARGLVVHFRRPGSQQQFSQVLKEQYLESAEFRDLVPWIAGNIQNNLTVDELAERCSMSPRHFARRFKQVFRRTPARFVLEHRLESSKRLLSDTELNITQIARKCGFNDDGVFRKAFARHLHMSPAEYRKLWSLV